MRGGRTPHEVLGIGLGASEKEIRKAFRRKASLFHPDRNQSPGARERFEEAKEACDLLLGRGPHGRGMAGVANVGTSVDVMEMFEMFFGKGQGGEGVFAADVFAGGELGRVFSEFVSAARGRGR